MKLVKLTVAISNIFSVYTELVVVYPLIYLLYITYYILLSLFQTRFK